MPVLKSVYSQILQTYPFISTKEKVLFKLRARLVLLGKRDELRTVRSLINLLNNPHADIIEINPKWKAPSKKTLWPSFKIKNKILYLDIPSWSKALEGVDQGLIDICIKNQDKYKGIVIDVRENNGGNSLLAHSFAGIFFKEDVDYGHFLKREGNGLKKLPAILPANNKYFTDKPIAILISQRCFSSCELFLAPFKITKRALLVGEKTRGGSGNPVTEKIEIQDKKYKFRVPTWRFYLKGEKRPLEETKIKPDFVYVKEDIVKFAALSL